MQSQLQISFSRITTPTTGTILFPVADGLALPPSIEAADAEAALPRAFAIGDFSGGFGSSIDLLAPAGTKLDRFCAIGAGKPGALNEYGWMKFGGVAAINLRNAQQVTLALDFDGADAKAAANVAAGMVLRNYSYDKHKTKRDEKDEKRPKTVKIVIQCADPAGAKKAWVQLEPVVNGVVLARDLVNEPANTLGPVEFAAAAKDLERLGLKVSILTEKEMTKLGMGSLLGVAQGSSRPSRIAVMQWDGGKKGDKPVALIGKGVVFDTGGNSMKTSAGMEDMKGDMGGAAAVTGAMMAIAGRKAKANVIGLIGVVENMVDGNAQRPGDIVKSMSGQTIEVLNTDAEGRLVLADVLWYCQQKYKPKLMIDLATLTGAIMVSLGQFHAGLFSNDDTLSEQLIKAGQETYERLWRMPMGDDYDKLINSRNADMKNIGGRYGGAVSAAQFLQRFVKDTPWAHLDIAGTAMAAPNSEINTSWGTGFGVRLLDRFVRDTCE